MSVDILEEPEAPVFNPNTGQRIVIESLVARVKSNPRFYKALLEGYAGTGKTWTVNRVVEAIKTIDPRLHIGMTAPTHKAVRQLRKHSELKDELEFGTIHSLLGLKEVLKPSKKNPNEMVVTYELDWNSKKERKIDSIDLLIVDEASMLNDDLYNHIDDVCRNRPDLLVLFMGDGLQIPPVGKKQETGNADAIPFVAAQRQSRQIEHFILSEIVRQGAGNPIIEYASFIRNNVQVARPVFSFPEPEEDHGVEIIPQGREPFATLLRKYFKTPEFEQDPDFVKVVAYRNSTVDHINKMVREILYERTGLPKLLEGERLVMDKPLVLRERIVIANNEEILVKSLEETTHTLTYVEHAVNHFDAVTATAEQDVTLQFKVYKCRVSTSEGHEHDVIIMHEDSEVEFQRTLEKLRQSALQLGRTGNKYKAAEMWRQFYKLGEPFAWVKYNYCLTAHKSQGSTYDYCFSMEWDINICRDVEECNRIRYVAATRARKKLFIMK